MAYPWGLIAFVVGIVWGLVIPGRQSKLGTLINGVLVGLLVGVVFAVIGFLTNQNPLGFGTTIWAFVVTFFVLTLLFVLGVWIGDLIEGAMHRGRTGRTV